MALTSVIKLKNMELAEKQSELHQVLALCLVFHLSLSLYISLSQ